MTDDPKRVREAKLMLANRAKRLARLIDLEAPDIILINEAMLVADAAAEGGES